MEKKKTKRLGINHKDMKKMVEKIRELEKELGYSGKNTHWRRSN